MRQVFKALLKSPNGMTTVEFAKLLGITRAQLAGVFGAFGRRLSHTEGFPDDDSDAWLATNNWNGSERRYVLTPLGRAALQDNRVTLG
jgi:Flp pilus assembly pilin Flp